MGESEMSSPGTAYDVVGRCGTAVESEGTVLGRNCEARCRM